jgi:hypothetical protein
VDDFDAVLKARRLSGQTSADQVPPPLEVYARAYVEMFTLVASLTPFIRTFVRDVETSSASSEQKRVAVLQMVGTVYEGARRLGILDGVKELKSVPWSQVEPLAAVVVDGVVAMYKAVGVFPRTLTTPPR